MALTTHVLNTSTGEPATDLMVQLRRSSGERWEVLKDAALRQTVERSHTKGISGVYVVYCGFEGFLIFPSTLGKVRVKHFRSQVHVRSWLGQEVRTCGDGRARILDETPLGVYELRFETGSYFQAAGCGILAS